MGATENIVERLAAAILEAVDAEMLAERIPDEQRERILVAARNRTTEPQAEAAQSIRRSRAMAQIAAAKRGR